ncbi:hypothetical protein niasHS_015451 [Heterodera schachtii]|uniref:Uncharacterized protein n=1 Tax=Heterodera schachtii TaxID=97005 RepID=A0ABD2I4G8_HETSC
MHCCFSCVDKWICCCGFHMTAAALVIAWIWLISAISMVPSLLISLYSQAFDAYNISNAVSIILLTAQSVPIIVAEMRGKRTPQMYMPFLWIQLAFTMIGGIVIFFTLDQMRQQMGGYTKEVIGGILFGFLLVLIIYFWCYSIVFRAYKFVKQKNDEKNQHNAKDIQI